jgi:Flp pilus assembly protein TadG
MNRLSSFLRQFGRREDGQLLVEFALAVPLVFTIFLTSVEMGMVQVRQMFLERGLDVAVRDIRLNTSAKLTPSQVKQKICDQAGFLPDCMETLRLEMTTADMRSFAAFGASADCIDTSQPITPLRQFVHGNNHELMMIRACYMFKPVFPTSGLGKQFAKDGSGRVKMVAYSGFVQEPS